MAKRKIVDAAAAVLAEAELGIVRAARQAVQAVNRRLGAKRKRKGRKTAAKKSARMAVSKTGRPVRKIAKKRLLRKAARNATKKAARGNIGRRQRR